MTYRETRQSAVKVTPVVALSAWFCAVAALVPTLTTADVMYKALDLGFDAGAINDRGQVVGVKDGEAVVWQKGWATARG